MPAQLHMSFYLGAQGPNMVHATDISSSFCFGMRL